MANSLRAWIKQMRYTGKTTPKRAERMIKALDLADAIIKADYLEYDSKDEAYNAYARGYNKLLRDVKGALV